MDAPLNNVRKFPIQKFVEEGENEMEIEKKALLNNLENEKSLVDKLKFEEESQVVTIESVLVKIDTFTFPMDFVAWGIKGDLQNLKILRRALLSSSQAWIDINKGELTLLVDEEKARFNLHQPLPLIEQERAMCRKLCSLLPSKGHMFEQSPLRINVFASASHKGDCFEEIVVKPPATIKGDYEFLSPLQSLEEIILELNGCEKKVLSKMDDWSNGSTSCHAWRRETLDWDSLPAFLDIGGPSLITISKYRIQKYKIKTTTVVVFTVSYTYSPESHLHIQNCTFHLHDQSVEPTCGEPLQVCWPSRMRKIMVISFCSYTD